MLRLSSHTSANVGNVGKHGLLCAFSVHLRRNQGELLLVTGEFRVVRVQEGVESGEELMGRGELKGLEVYHQRI